MVTGELIMRFSILIPVYNPSIDYFKRCVNSVAHQLTKHDTPYRDYEVIFVFDGNYVIKDAHESFVKHEMDFSFCKWRIISNDKQRGVSATRNDCLRYAQGDWIVWCDCDDYLELKALSTLEEYILRHQKLFDGYCYKTNVLTEKSDLVYSESMIDNYIGDYTYQLDGSTRDWLKVPETLWQKCISRKYILDNNLTFNDNIMLYDDWYWHERLLATQPKLKKIDYALYNYNIREGSLSTNSESQNKRDYIEKVRKFLLADLPKDVPNYTEAVYMINKYCEEFLKV